MRAVIAIAAFAVAANARALPDGSSSDGLDVPLPVEPVVPADVKGNDPNVNKFQGTTTTHHNQQQTTTTAHNQQQTTTTHHNQMPTTTTHHSQPTTTGMHNGGGDNHNGGGDNHNGGGDNHNGGGDNHNGGGDNHNGGGDNHNGGGSNDYPYNGDSGSNYDNSGSNYNGGSSYDSSKNTYQGQDYGAASQYSGAGSNSYYQKGSNGYAGPSEYSSYSKPSNYASGYSSYQAPYPSKGYSQPSSYPSGCAWSKPNPPSPPANCNYNTPEYPYNIHYPAVGDYGQPSNCGNDYAPAGYTHNSAYGLYSPAHGEGVQCGSKHKFVWSAFPKSRYIQIDVVYGKGGSDCNYHTTIHPNCENTGSYEWDVPHCFAPTGSNYGYGLKLTCKDTGEVWYSPQFHFQDDTFYDTCKHPACPTAAPPVCEVKACTNCCPPPPPPTTCPPAISYPTSPASSPASYAAPPAVSSAPEETANYTAAASTKAFSVVAGFAALAAFVL